MSNPFRNRVFGCVLIKSINSNFNADFSHQPRTLPDGTVYATDKALKYSVRNFLKNAFPTEKIFYSKSMDGKMQPRTLDERYQSYFGDYPKMTAIDKGEYLIFKSEGGQITPIVTAQPKPNDIKKFFKSLDDDDEWREYQSKLPKKDDKQRKKEEATTLLKASKELFEEDEDFFFYIDKANKPKKFNGDFDILNGLMKKLDELSTGGVDRKKITENLLTCLDVRLFGGTYAGVTNLSFHGPLQITHGINRFPDNNIFSEQISSPFRNPGEKNQDSTMTTLGSQSKLREGHYVFHFSINPQNLDELVRLSGGSPLLVSDVEKAKAGLSRGVTLYDSAAKAGSENELMLWVQLKEDSMLVLPSFVELLKVAKDDKRTIDLSPISEILKRDHVKSAVEKIEIWYDKATTTLSGMPDEAIFLDINA